MQHEVVHAGSNAMVVVKLSAGEVIKAEAGAMVAKSDNVTIEGKMDGGLGKALKRSLAGGEQFFFQTMKAETAPGEVMIAPAIPGDIKILDMLEGQDYIVDNGHIVAWSGDTGYTIEKAAKGWMSTFTSGEGLVCRFKGPGKVWLQTRNPQGSGSWIRKFVPVANSRN